MQGSDSEGASQRSWLEDNDGKWVSSWLALLPAEPYMVLSGGGGSRGVGKELRIQ